MLTSIEGVYRNGQIEILEKPERIEEANVIITFLPTSGSIDLQARGINKAQAADLRARLRSFVED